MSEAKRILYIDTITELVGGAEISLLTLMENLDQTRLQPYLLTSGPGSFVDAARQAGIEAQTQDFPWLSRRRPWPFLLSIVNIARLVRRNKIALMHSNCDYSLRYVRYANRISGVPYVAHVRDSVRAWFRPANLAALNQAQAVIANSNSIAEICRNAGIKEQIIKTIYNGVDIEAFRRETPQTRKLLNETWRLPDTATVVGFVGQPQAIKGLGEFIEAAINLARANLDLYFLVVGKATNPRDQAFLDECRARVQAAILTDRIIFLGYRKDIASVMKAIDILAVPSYNDAFGRVAVEGMASGCTVVATNVEGLTEIITNRHDGLLIATKSASALQQAIIELVHNPMLRQTLSQNAQRTVERFTIKNHVTQMEALYSNILNDQRAIQA